MVASSLYMVINRTNIFNNTAQFGGVISACNSEVTLRGDSLIVIVDPLLPFCKLYDETVQHANITPPPETIITTERMVTTEAPIHTQSDGVPTSSPNPSIPDQTNIPATPNVVPQTTHGSNDSVISATAGNDDHTHAATDPLNEGTKLIQSPTSIQSTTKFTLLGKRKRRKKWLLVSLFLLPLLLCPLLQYYL